MSSRSQVALEFIITVGLALVLITLILLFVGSKSDEISYLQDREFLEDYMSSIQNEILILNQMLPGYYREVEIPDPIVETYNITIINGSFVVHDKIKNLSYFYSYPYNGTVEIINKTVVEGGISRNALFIVFKR